MITLIAKRLVQLIPTLFFVSVLIFLLQQLLPGDPALAMAGEEQDPAVLDQIRRQYRLDRSIPVQYLYWIGGVLTGDLGESMRLKVPVLDLIAQKLPVTLQLASMAIFFAKTLFFVFVTIWIRWTLPRFRVDQMMNMCWKYFIPVSLVSLILVSGWEWLVPPQGRELVRYAMFAVFGVGLAALFFSKVIYTYRSTKKTLRLQG